MVATINCQNATLLIEAKRALLYTHGGTGENRMRMIRGKPFASYFRRKSAEILSVRTKQRTTTSSRALQRSFDSDRRFKRDLKTNLSSKNEKAAPRKVAGHARRKPLIPQAKPHMDMRVVKPTRGGTEHTTRIVCQLTPSWRVPQRTDSLRRPVSTIRGSNFGQSGIGHISAETGCLDRCR
jgi:hypothetical protein